MTTYPNFIFENDFETRRKMIIPLLVKDKKKTLMNELITNPTWYYERCLNINTRAEKKQYLQEQELIIETELNKYYNNIIDNKEFSYLMHFGKKYYKNFRFVLYYILYLDNQEDRQTFYDAFLNKKTIDKKTIERHYDNINYRYYHMVLPFSIEQQNEYRKAREYITIDEEDDLREKEGLFTRRDLIKCN